MSRTPLYNTWRNIHQKCLNPNSPAYKYYGGRGISVCDEWKSDFLTFYNWANANGYRDGLTIDRINNDGDYTPNNCRWVTMKEQSINKRNTVTLEYNGITKSIKEWSDDLGFKREVLKSRLKNGWSAEETLTTPSSFHNKLHRR